MTKIRTPQIKKRWGMYPEQFALLEKGDIIKGRGGDLRIVQQTGPTWCRGGNRGSKETYFIHLLKLRPSWTKGSYTTYCIGDSFNFQPVKVKNRKIWDLDYEAVQKLRRQKYEVYKKKKIKELEKQLKRINLI